MPIIESLAVPQHRFKDDDGVERTKWLQCGRLVEGPHGNRSVKLDCIPTFVADKEGNEVSFDGWFHLFPYTPKPAREEAGKDKKRKERKPARRRPYAATEPAKDYSEGDNPF